MKIFNFILITLLISQNIFSQIVHRSNTPRGNDITYHGSNFIRNATPATPYDSLTPYVLNVYFTLVNDFDNSNSYPNLLGTPELVEAKFLECIKFLNKNFTGTNIFFKYAGYQTVQNAIIFSGDVGVVIPPSNNPQPWDVQPYVKADAMNIMFTTLSIDNIDFFTYRNYNISLLSMDLLDSSLLERTIVHTMGHNLSLYHTDEAISHFEPTHPLFNFTACEHITRINDGSDPQYNADIAGDEVADTPAQPILQDSFFTSCGAYNFDITRVNCEPLPYQNLTTGNPMNSINFSNLSNCPIVSFTAGQTKKMREFIFNNPTTLYENFPSLVGIVANTRNTVESLFKPYSTGTVFLPTILSTTDNGDGTAKVCRGLNSANFKFQPGFTYSFLEEPEVGAPIVYAATVDANLVIVENPVFNCPVRIEELSPTLTNLSSNIRQVETVCRGEICVNEPFVSGTDTRTDILGSMNITIEQLNKIQVNDPKLYEKLMQEYYHILEKYTASGAKTKEVFYKQ